MNATALLQFFDRHRARGDAMVLATVVATQGSTYSKTGDQILIDGNGVACGMLSGGCLEADLSVRGGIVLQSGRPQLVNYDLALDDAEPWGLGVGCDGSMQVLLQRLAADNDYQPFAAVAAILRGDTPAPVRIECAELGVAVTFPVRPSLRLLILGAGPDAVPLARIATGLGWRCTVADHRPAYVANPDFPQECITHCCAARDLNSRISLHSFDAAVVMSHHLESDRAYLRQLAPTSIPYVGLLGPPGRRDRLLADIGSDRERLQGRLHGPAGLDLGGRGPELIALAIAAQVQQLSAAG